MSKSLGYCPQFGNYPKEYNRAVHGPYYPWINYGKQDTHFSQVKLGELRDWLKRRSYTPASVVAAFSRGLFLYHHKWTSTKYGSPSKSAFHLLILASLLSLPGCYGLVKQHRQHKYHW